MEVVFSPLALKHVEYWKKTNNLKTQSRISELIKAITIDPYKGIGKPEPLKHQLAGKWSRRIDKENRIIYNIENKTLSIYSLKGHYL
jgi:toxin YoeB